MPTETAADLLAKILDNLDGQQACLSDTASLLEWATKLLADVIGEQSHVVQQLKRAWKMNDIALTLNSDIGFDLRQLMPSLIDVDETTEGK
jgi:hypothetical protein